MASRSVFLLLVLVACLVAVSCGTRQVRRRRSVPKAAAPRIIAVGPVNTAVMAGSQARLNCQASQTGSPRVQWWEYITVPTGAQISDGDLLLPGHPNAARYTLEADLVAQTYNLLINTEPADGGLYQCRDLNANSGSYADLVIIEKTPNCTSTLPPNGIVTEGDYYSIECQVFYSTKNPNVAPYLYWTGPDSYVQAYLKANNSVWAGAHFNVNKTMDGRSFKCNMNFTEEGFGGIDTATNAPSWTYTYTTTLLFVQYGPQNVSYSPVQPTYEIGQVLTCNADSVPLPSYTWTNMITMVDYSSQTLTLTEDMAGLLVLRCQVINSVSSANLFVNITLNARTTPTPSPTTVTTTTTPPITKCNDITGRWEAKRSDTSTIVLCLNVDASQNGLIRGLLQNDTNEPYMTELIGRTRNYEYDESGWTGIWPERIGVSSYAAECHSCFGIEVMQVNLISRSSLDSVFCDGGSVAMSEQYTFTRKPISFPCSSSLATMMNTLETANEGFPRSRRLH